MSDAAGSEALRQAAAWFAQLQSEQAGEPERAAWRAWLQAHPSHRRAWQLVEEVRQQFGQAPQAAGRALDAAGRSRRRALGQLAAVLGVGGATALLYRAAPWRPWLADYRTAVGERRQLTLPDGSSLHLNTASAVDVAYTASRRLLRLRAGEVLVSTAPDPAAQARPFLVSTPQGEALALGTRFTVRLDGDDSEVAVLEKAVRVTPANGAPVTVAAGWRLRFDHSACQAAQPNDASVGSWQYGSLVAVDMPLGRLVAELARHRHGYLGCHPAVAALPVSGAFPLDDTERALDALARSFPLRIERHTRYWASVEPR